MNLTQEQKDRISMLIRAELSKVEEQKYRNQMIILQNQVLPALEDEEKQKKRDDVLDSFRRIVEMYTKDSEMLENIQKELGC